MVNFLFFLGFLFSQFYILPSGWPQPSHFILALASMLVFIKFSKNVIKIEEYRWILFFLLYSILVNIIFSLLSQDAVFLVASVYIGYGFFVSYFSFKYLSENQSAEKIFSAASLFGLLLIVVFFFLGLGDYKFNPRYNAFFNDPNQMAYWALCALAVFLWVGSASLPLKVIAFLLAGVIVMASMSRSALIGIIVMSLGVMLGAGGKMGGWRIFLSLILFIPSVVFFVIYFSDGLLDTWSRLTETDFSEQADDRGYGRLIDYYEYLIFGAGQGLDIRFNDRGTEIHSTWVGLLFYYGLIGISLFLTFILAIFKKLNFSQFFIFLGPVFYGFSTLGFRTPIFWIFLATALYVGIRSKATKQNASKLVAPIAPENHFSQTPKVRGS